MRIISITVCLLILFFLSNTFMSPTHSHAAFKSLHLKVKVKTLKLPEFASIPQEKDVASLTDRAAKGDTEAKVLLGCWFLSQEEPAKSVELLKQPAEAGNAEGQYLYAFALDPAVKSEEAKAWIKKSAGQGYLPALDALMDFSSFETPEDTAETIALLRQSASLGDAQSAPALGNMYAEGDKQGINHDAVAAYTWLYLARHGFSPPAESESGRELGDDKSYNDNIDLPAYTMTLDEIKQVKAALAAWPASLPPEVPPPAKASPQPEQDTRHRATLLSPAEIEDIKNKAEAGDHKAQLRLGIMYRDGRGVQKDKSKSLELLKKAAGGDSEEALLALADFYENEDEQNEAAREVYERLAVKGNPVGQTALGKLLLPNGYDSRRDEEAMQADKKTAVKWLTKAARQNHVEAILYLGEHYYENDNRKLAAALCEQAAALGEVVAVPGLIDIGESEENQEMIYKWLSIYMRTLPPEERRHVRIAMVLFTHELTEDAVRRLKKDSAAWLKKNPKLLKNNRSIAAGAEQTSKKVNKKGRTPLHPAAQAKGLNIAKLLLKSGALINAQGIYRGTPLSLATRQGNKQAVALLPAEKADLSIGKPLKAVLSQEESAITPTLINAGADLNVADGEGAPPLLQALNNENKKAVKLLLVAKADPNIADKNQATSLHNAIVARQKPTVLLLLAAGADPNQVNARGLSPLHLAVGDPELLKILIDAKADVNAVDPNTGQTALCLAVFANNTEEARLLLKAKADPNIQCKHAQTPLYKAADWGGSIKMVRLLLNAGADPNLGGISNFTPLFNAISQHEPNLEIVKALINAKPDFSVKIEYGGTVLHFAASEQKSEIVRLLLAAKVDPNMTDNSGRSVLDVASDPAIIKILEAAGAKSAHPDDENIALYDALGRPRNKAAKMDSAPGSKHKGKTVRILLKRPKEIEEINKTIAEERKGNRTRYLTRVVIMGAGPEELAERIKAGADVNVEDPMFGFALAQAYEQNRGPEVVRCLLDNGEDPNRGSPLLEAVQRNDGTVAMLLDAGANPMIMDDEKTPALILAVNKGNKENVAALLKAGAKPKAKDKNGHTAMDVLKRQKKNIPLAVLLLQHGAPASAKDSAGDNLVHWAVHSNSLELLAAAVEAKAPVNAFDSDGNTPLKRAVLDGNAAMVSALLKAGVPVNKSAIRRGRRFMDSKNKLYPGEDDILAQAIREGNEEVIKVLIAAGVHLNARENTLDRYTALHKSVMEELPGITAMLLNAGAKPDIGDSSNNRPLHVAVRKRDPQFLALLLAEKANPNVQNDDGETPLYKAVLNNKITMAEALLKAGANPNLATKKSRIIPPHEVAPPPNAYDNDGSTPLHLAAHRNNAEVVRLLLDAKADCNAKKNDGSTPLLLAALKSDPKTIKTLLDAGATVNNQSVYSKETALHHAAKAGATKAVALLLTAGADPAAKDKDGATPLDVAAGEDVARLLKNAER